MLNRRPGRGRDAILRVGLGVALPGVMERCAAADISHSNVIAGTVSILDYYDRYDNVKARLAQRFILFFIIKAKAERADGLEARVFALLSQRGLGDSPALASK